MSETAMAFYRRLRAAGESTGWAGYCSNPDYCTSPCQDCGREGRISECVVCMSGHKCCSEHGTHAMPHRGCLLR